MKVISIRGVADSGKTMTLNALLSWFPTATQSIISHNRIRLGKDPNDFFVEFPYNNKIIGIVSPGDPCQKGNQTVQEPILRQYKQRNIDIIICACRLSGSTVELLKKTIFSTVSIDFVDKKKYAYDDNNIAKTIFNKI